MRYQVLPYEEVKALGAPVIDDDCYKNWDEWEEDYRHMIEDGLLFLIDTKLNSIVYWETYEVAPEDMNLNRVLLVFVDELNRLAKESNATT